jgi:uncharacterized membrane protein YqjE
VSEHNEHSSLSDTLGRMATGVAKFVRYEIDLAALEAQEDIERALAASRLLILGTIVGIGAVGALVAATILGLTAALVAIGMDQNLASTLSALLVALIFGGTAWALLANGMSGLRVVGERLEHIISIFAKPAVRERAPR